MDRTLTASSASTSPPAPVAPGLRLFATLVLWARNVRTRRQLASLDDRALADVGISRGERLAELERPFWR